SAILRPLANSTFRPNLSLRCTMIRWLARLRSAGSNRKVRPPRHLPPRLEQLEDRLAPAVITVTSANDDLDAPSSEDGTVSLREAITSINNGADFNADVTAKRTGTYGDNDTIKFDIINANGTVQTINVGGTGNGALPTLTLPMKIDGYTEPG